MTQRWWIVWFGLLAVTTEAEAQRTERIPGKVIIESTATDALSLPNNGSITQSGNTNGAVLPLISSNASNGTSAYVEIRLGNDVDSNAGTLRHTSSGFTATGAYRTNALHLLTTRTGGVVIGSTNTAGDVYIRAGNLLHATFNATDTGRNAPLNIDPADSNGGNQVLWGHPNSEFTSALGAFSGTGLPFIAAYGYHSSTANTIARASGTNLPIVMAFNTTGGIDISKGNTGTADGDATLTTLYSLEGSGQFRVRTDGTAGGVAVTDGTDTALFYKSTLDEACIRIASIDLFCGDTTSTTTGRKWFFNQPSGSAASFDRDTTDGDVVEIRQDGTQEGSISVSGTTVSYNAFMGSHYTQLRPGQQEPRVGEVVVSTGEVIPATRADDNERFVYVQRSSRRNQRGVYGVWFASLNKTAEGMSWGDPTQTVYTVAGLGLAQAWVTNTCGDLRVGDLIASSPRVGLAERQCTHDGRAYDGVVRDWTLGKVLVPVDWSTVRADADGAKRVLVPVILMAG